MFRNLARLASLALACAVIFVTLCPIHLRPQTGHALNERFAAFALLGAAVAMGWPGGRWRDALVLIAFAAGLEYAQHFAPTRHAHVADALQKAAGALFGVAAAHFGDRTWRRLWPRRAISPDAGLEPVRERAPVS